MSNDSRQVDVAPIVRVSQIIVGAMFAGVLMFMVVAVVARKPASAAPLVVTSIAALFAAGVLVARALVLANLARKARRDLLQARAASVPAAAGLPKGLERDAPSLLPALQMRTIVGSALCEGPAFFAIVAYLVEGNLWSLGLAGFLALCLLSNLPTSSRVLQWIEEQEQLLQLERMRAS